MIFRLDEHLIFPPTELAEPDGLLAVGGDLSTDRLMLAYQHGIFPWYSEENPILWYSPHERFVLFPDELRLSKSMRQVMRSGQFTITQNKNFEAVINACALIPRADQDGTWITPEMKDAYIALNGLGRAHSIEVWKNGILAGGLYGVQVGNVFCGESMFSNTSNASKMALAYLCTQSYVLIDCQVYTDHLASMGARMIDRAEYMNILSANAC